MCAACYFSDLCNAFKAASVCASRSSAALLSLSLSLECPFAERRLSQNSVLCNSCAQQTPCSVWVWHDSSMGQWAYTCILWSMLEAGEHGRADIESWVEQVVVLFQFPVHMRESFL